MNYELVSYNIPNYYFVNKPKDLTNEILSCESSSGFDTAEVDCKFIPPFNGEDLPKYFIYSNKLYMTNGKGMFGTGYSIAKFDKADVDSFRFSNFYTGASVDKFHAYCGRSIVEGANRDTFMPFYFDMPFYVESFGLHMKDKNHIYKYNDSYYHYDATCEKISEGDTRDYKRIGEYLEKYGVLDDYLYFINDRVMLRNEVVAFFWRGFF